MRFGEQLDSGGNILVANIECLHKCFCHVIAIEFDHLHDCAMESWTPVFQIGEASFFTQQLSVNHHRESHVQNNIVINSQAQNNADQSKLCVTFEWSWIEPGCLSIILNIGFFKLNKCLNCFLIVFWGNYPVIFRLKLTFRQFLMHFLTDLNVFLLYLKKTNFFTVKNVRKFI